MKRHIVILPDGRETVFWGDERAALVFARAVGGQLKAGEGSAPEHPPAENEEKSRRRR